VESPVLAPRSPDRLDDRKEWKVADGGWGYFVRAGGGGGGDGKGEVGMST
jgi:hypothetical protein